MSDPDIDGEQAESPLLTVGIGASAGGLEAYQTFFKSMPPNSGMAFVIVQHLFPRKPSMLAELLARRTAMPVQEAKDGLRIEPDHVYIIPPNASLGVERGRLRVIVPLAPERRQTVIDDFFGSLAADQGANAVCIILSGAGHEGTLGVKAVKEHGGLTMAQNVATAAHASMPRSAAAAGFVDQVLDVDKMPQALLDYAANLRRINGHGGARPIQASLSDHLRRIHALLRDQRGHDFSRYKENTVLRRVQRRMQVLHLADVGSYVERLAADLAETDHLFRDLLVGVTRFFRDPAAFEALGQHVIKPLVASRPAGERIRVWVPGCGSGEEPYSIAILFLEAFAELEQPPELQIFGTDLDEAALAAARAGVYSSAALAEMPSSRLKRFFLPDEGLYRVTKGLRATCMFAIQNVVSDPPFSRLDLISCRNLLIYFRSDLQERLLPLFHYALREEGALFLGSAETIGRHGGRLFTPIDRKQRIFRRRVARAPTRPSFPADSLTRPGRDARGLPETRPEPSPSQWAEGVMFSHFTPAFVVIDEHFEVIRFSAQLAPFLDPTAGNATLNVFSLIHRDLRMELRAALQKARNDRSEVRQEGIRLRRESGESSLIDLIVEPRVVADRESVDFFLVIFREGATGLARSQSGDSVVPDDARAAQLEYELGATRERLHTSIEQLETLNEELASSNEELLSSNEELQSSNEELEASHEELQSLNEELETVNNELRDKVDELDRAHNDLLNLFDSTAIATVFLDPDLRIKRFTPALTEVIAVRPGDEGRLVGDFALKFEYARLLDDVRAAVGGGAIQEVEVTRSEDGRIYLLRIAPYVTTERTIEGAVLTFVDISRVKEVEQQLRTYRNRSEIAIAASRGGLYEHAVPPGPDTYYSERWIQLLGYAGNELPEPRAFRDWLSLHAHPDDRVAFVDAYERLVRGEVVDNSLQIRLHHKDGHWVWVRYACQPIERDADGHPVRVAGLMFDTSTEHGAADELRQALRHLHLALDAGGMGMWEWDVASHGVVWDEQIFALLGLDPALTRPSPEAFLDALHPDERDELWQTIDRLRTDGEPYNRAFRIVRPDGGIRWLRGLGNAERDATGRPVRLIGVLLDASEGRRRVAAPERSPRPRPPPTARRGTGKGRAES